MTVMKPLGMTATPSEFRFPEPVPTPDTATYQAVIEQRLAFNARTRENYERFKACRDRKEDLGYLPIRLDIENVSRCNSACIMCQVSQWPGRKRAGDMSLKDFKALIDEQYGLIDIKLHGMGEPLLGGNTFFEQIRYARAQKIWVRTVTNASLLHVKENYKKLIESGINEVQISIDSADKATYEDIRKGLKFDRVRANCKLINGYCEDLGIVRTKMWTMVMKNNIGQLSDLVDLAHEIGFRHQVFSLDFTDWGQEEWRERHSGIRADEKFNLEIAKNLVEKGERLGVRVAFWTIDDKYSREPGGHLCPWPFERAYIGSDQRVVPCPMIGNPDTFEIGSMDGSLTKVWHSRDYENFRRSHLSGDLHTVCKSCYKRK